VVLDGRVRQADAVGGCLPRSRDEDGRDHADLPVGGALGGVTRRPTRHALRASEGTGGFRGVALTIRKRSDR
jgi:hypothetical protein